MTAVLMPIRGADEMPAGAYPSTVRAHPSEPQL